MNYQIITGLLFDTPNGEPQYEPMFKNEYSTEEKYNQALSTHLSQGWTVHLQTPTRAYLIPEDETVRLQLNQFKAV